MNDPEYEAWLEDRELGPQSEGVYVDALGVPESGEPEPDAEPEAGQ